MKPYKTNIGEPPGSSSVSRNLRKNVHPQGQIAHSRAAVATKKRGARPLPGNERRALLRDMRADQFTSCGCGCGTLPRRIWRPKMSRISASENRCA